MVEGGLVGEEEAALLRAELMQTFRLGQASRRSSLEREAAMGDAKVRSVCLAVEREAALGDAQVESARLDVELKRSRAAEAPQESRALNGALVEAVRAGHCLLPGCHGPALPLGAVSTLHVAGGAPLLRPGPPAAGPWPQRMLEPARRDYPAPQPVARPAPQTQQY